MGLLVNGGGGVPKSRLVAAATQAANVLKNTFFVNSTGARTEGTMTDNQGQTVTASAVDKSGSNIRMKIPARACYDTSSYVQKAASDFGDAAAGDILTGKKATSSNGLNLSGTMSEYSGQAVTASSVDKNGTNIRMKLPNTGKYSNASYVQKAASDFGSATAADVDSSVTFTSSAGVKIQGTGNKVSVSGNNTAAESSGTSWSFSAVVGGIYVLAVQSIYDACSISSGATLLGNKVTRGGYAVRDTDGTIKSNGTVTLLAMRATDTTVTMSINSRTWAGSAKLWIRVA